MTAFIGDERELGEVYRRPSRQASKSFGLRLQDRLAGGGRLSPAARARRAQELGMKDTAFVNCTGLPAAGHHSSAYDIALMSRELILHHPDILFRYILPSR